MYVANQIGEALHYHLLGRSSVATYGNPYLAPSEGKLPTVYVYHLNDRIQDAAQHPMETGTQQT